MAGELCTHKLLLADAANEAEADLCNNRIGVNIFDEVLCGFFLTSFLSVSLLRSSLSVCRVMATICNSRLYVALR